MDDIKESPKSIMEFRDDHIDERKNFMNSYKKYHESLTNITANEVRVDAILDHQENLIRSIHEFKMACYHLWASSFIGYRAVTFPCAAEAVSKIMTVNPTTEMQLLGGGIALGVVWTLYSAQRDYRDIKKMNPNSYLLNLKKLSLTSSSEFNNCLHSNILEYWED